MRLEEAKKYDNWIRFENVIRGKYAHAVSSELIKIENENKLAEFIVNLILNKYTFKNSKNDSLVEFSQKLRDLKGSSSYYYSQSKYVDNSISQQLNYLLENSGLSSFIYKLNEIDKENEKRLSEKSKLTYVQIFLLVLLNYVNKKYRPSKDTQKWLRERKKIYVHKGISCFDSYLIPEEGGVDEK